MNNLRLWGHVRSSLHSQMHDTQQSRVANAGLIEKFNQLKSNIQEARTSALQVQEAIIEINNKDKAVDALVAHSNTITTNLQQTQQQMETTIKWSFE